MCPSVRHKKKGAKTLWQASADEGNVLGLQHCFVPIQLKHCLSPVIILKLRPGKLMYLRECNSMIAGVQVFCGHHTYRFFIFISMIS